MLWTASCGGSGDEAQSRPPPNPTSSGGSAGNNPTNNGGSAESNAIGSGGSVGGPCAVDNGGCGAGVSCQATASGAAQCGDCQAGQTGTPPRCVDVDECSTNNGGCDALTSCANAAASGLPPNCGPCPFGYTGTGNSGCSDVDECASNNGPCGAGVLCVNDIGSYACGNCPPGQTGTAPDCLDIDECAIANGTCDPLKTCTNVSPSSSPPLCGACPAGYEDTAAGRCADIDECALDNGGCGPLSTCMSASVPGVPATCGPNRPAIDRLEPSSNPPGSFVLVVGRAIERATTREIRVNGVVLAETSIEWPPADLRFGGTVAIQLPASLAPGGTVNIELVNEGGVSSPASVGILSDFPPGPWPPSRYIFPRAPDVTSVPLVTVDPVSAAPPTGPGYEYDFDGNAANGEDLQSQCLASFAGTECLDSDVFDDQGFFTRESCSQDPNPSVEEDEVAGTCIFGSDVLFGRLGDAQPMCCDGGDPLTPECDSGVILPCSNANCSDCAEPVEFVPCNSFSGNWNIADNRIQLTVARRTGPIAYQGECMALDTDADPATPGTQRPCGDVLLRDPEGRQLLLPIDSEGSFSCN